MSLPADFDLKERVRGAVDIIDVVGRDLELRPQGRHFVARCPFHNDRRPSMTVNQERQTWKCWVCDIGGDIFSFVMQREGVDFPSALRMLAEQAGIPIEEYTRGPQAKPGSPEDKATLLAAMKLVADAYFDLLQDGTSEHAKLARDYLAERGIDDENRRRFRIGFSPDSWTFAVDLLRKYHFSGEVAEAAGLAIARGGESGRGQYDRFRGRLMFPIHDLQDRPISLGGRIIPALADQQGNGRAGAKYINGPETKLFRKSHQLYGLQLARDAIRRDGEALVMEGYTDVVAARQAGVEPVVAVLGTALGEQHIKILKRFAQRVVLVLDGDAAGQKRADEVAELFVHANVDMRVLTLPEGMDPADFLAQNGREAFDALVKDAPDALDHKLARLTEGIDVTRDTHRVTAAIDTMLGIMAGAPRTSGLRTDQIMLRLARTFGLPATKLEQRLEELRRQRASRRPAAGRPGNSPQRSGSTRYASREATPTSVRDAGPASFDLNAALSESSEVDESAAHWHEASAAPRRRQRGEQESLPPLTGIDRDLFETLIESPEIAAKAVEAVDPSWLESTTAKMLLSAYQDLELGGRDLDVASVLLIIENELLKNHVVTLEERVRKREGQSMASAEERYLAILTSYHQREFAAEKTRQIARLESNAMPEDEAMALLKELFEAEQTRHGINRLSP